MAPPAVLFDVFGTLVDYEPTRSRLGCPETHALATSFGFRADHETFVRMWDDASTALERDAAARGDEFSMTEAAVAFARAAGLALPDETVSLLGSTFVAEWQRHVRPIPGVAEMLCRLSGRHRLGIVSNTHDRAMVPALLEGMGAADLFEVVVLSVEHGRRKPCPTIYRAALAALRIDAPEAVFVGDSLEADYHGPRAVGVGAFVIDPARRHDVDPAHRLDSVLDIEAVLAARSATPPPRRQR